MDYATIGGNGQVLRLPTKPHEQHVPWLPRVNLSQVPCHGLPQPVAIGRAPVTLHLGYTYRTGRHQCVAHEPRAV